MGDNQATKQTKADAKNGLSLGGFNIGLYVKNALKSFFLQKMENNQAAKIHEDVTNDLRVGEIKIVLSVKNALYILVAWALVLFASISLMYWSYSVPKTVEGLDQVVDDNVNSKPGKWINVAINSSNPAATSVTSSSFDHLPLPSTGNTFSNTKI